MGGHAFGSSGVPQFSGSGRPLAALTVGMVERLLVPGPAVLPGAYVWANAIGAKPASAIAKMMCRMFSSFACGVDFQKK
jgi:hypothetical protein